MLCSVRKDKDGLSKAIVGPKVQSDVLLCRQQTKMTMNGCKVAVRVLGGGWRKYYTGKVGEIQLLTG